MRKQPTPSEIIRQLHGTPAVTVLRVLERPEIIKALGADAIGKLRARATAAIKRARRTACSGPRVDEATPGQPSTQIPGMVKSKQPVGFGDDRPTQRFTPAIAVALEDELDAMSPDDALTYYYPPSVSARVIEEMQIRHKRLLRTKIKRARSRK